MTAKQKSIIIGVIVGAVVGALGGFLFTRRLESPDDEEPRELSLRSIPPGELVKLSIAIMAVLRSIAELGERL